MNTVFDPFSSVKYFSTECQTYSFQIDFGDMMIVDATKECLSNSSKHFFFQRKSFILSFI